MQFKPDDASLLDRLERTAGDHAQVGETHSGDWLAESLAVKS